MNLLLLGLNKLITLGSNSIFNNFKWDKRGVDLYANVLDENGMGNIARGLYTALQTCDIPINVTQFSSLTSHKFPNHYPVNIILGGGESAMLTSVYNNIPPEEYTIGVWFWELEDYFPWTESYKYVDEIWCFSQFCYDIFTKFGNKPVYKFTYGPELNIIDVASPHRLQASYNINPHKFTFLYTFDYFGSIDRKNPYATVDAFIEAFGNTDDVQLIIKSMSNGGFGPEEAMFKHYIRNHENIIYINESLPRNELLNLIQLCDCYISLHRSEGLGIGIMEAMYLGKPVIVTAYGGSMEFTDPQCTLLVDYTLQPTMTNLCYYDPIVLWADPNVHTAASYMRYLYEHPLYALNLGIKCQQHILYNFNQRILNKQVKSRIHNII